MNTFKIAKETFNELFGELSIPVFLFDENGKLIKVNQSLYDLTGFGLLDFQTSNYHLILSHEEYKGVKESVLKNLPEYTFTEIKVSNDIIIPARLNFKKLKGEDGLLKGALGFIIDLREAHASEEKIKKITTENEALKEQLAGEIPDRILKEREKLKHEVKETKEFLENVVESCGDGKVILDNTAKITRVNESFAKMLGKEKKEIEGTFINELWPLEGTFRSSTGETITLDNSYHDHCVSKVEKQFLLAEDDKKLENWEVYVSNKNGEVIPLEINLTIRKSSEGVITGGVGYVRDITERKKAEKVLKKAHDELEKKVEERTADLRVINEQLKQEITERKRAEDELRETRDHLDNIIESSLDAIVVTDQTGYVTKANNSFMKLLGYKQKEIIGKNLMEFTMIEHGAYKSTTGESVEISMESFNNSLEIKEKLFEGGKISSWEVYFLRKDNKAIPCEANVVFLYNHEGDMTGAVGINRDITERKMAEKEIRESRDFLENIFKTTTDAIIATDNYGYIIRTNRAIEKIAGYREEELIGKHIKILSSQGEEHRKMANNMFKQLHEKGCVENWEQDCYRKDGTLCPVETSIAFLKNHEGNVFGSVGIIRDITERKRAVEELKEMKEQLESFIESSLDPIVICSSKGLINKANKAFLKMIGRSEDEIVNKMVHEFSITKEGTYESTTGELVAISENFSKESAEKIAQLREEGTLSNWITYYMNKENKIIPVNQNALFLCNDKGERTVIFTIIRNITEQRKAERDLQEANKFRRQFFTNITHEIRTPLTLSMGPIEGILRGECGKISGELRKQLSLALKNSRKLLKLINQLLEFSRLESGSQRLIYEKRDLNEFVTTILDSFTFIARRGKINLNFNNGNDMNVVYIDPIKTEKVLFNLIGNAFKFTPEGGSINVMIEKDNGSGVNKEGNYVKISVKDSGVGIKKEHLTHIFERFRQADGGTAREYGGTGIGLALTKELVELMGGTIEVESKYGRGSTFSIHLPIGEDRIKGGSKIFNESEKKLLQQPEIELSDLDHDQEKDAVEEGINGNKSLILIIDDNADLRHYMSGILKKDYNIITAQNGLGGLKRLDDYQPDLILCDIMMPKMDGYEFLKRVKYNPKHRHIPLIFITAKADTEMKIEGLEEGADDYIVKPFNSLELLARVKSSLRIRSLIKEKKAEGKVIIELKQKLEEKYHYGNIVGKSKSMRKIYHMLDTIKDTDSTVLITGETGTGKEVIANTIHYNSPRNDGSFVAVNCSAIPKELMEREFFGHIKGAYTGAYQDKKGYFEEAHGGTIFLDEIGSLDKSLQVKLLRVLENGEILRVGSSEPIKVDVRLITATNKDLLSKVRKGNFREDLYYRIYVIPIHISPLRERKEDIPLLIEHFLDKLQTKFKKKIPTFTEETLRKFINYSYPGNVRELENLMERLFLLSDKDYIQTEDIPFEIKNSYDKEEFLYDLTYKEAMEMARHNAERKILNSAIIGAGNNYQKAAEKLGISRSYFYKRLKICGIIESRA